MWSKWPDVVPDKGRLVDIIFRDGREEHGYKYQGGVVFLMPPDHSMYTYATPDRWRYSK